VLRVGCKVAVEDGMSARRQFGPIAGALFESHPDGPAALGRVARAMEQAP